MVPVCLCDLINGGPAVYGATNCLGAFWIAYAAIFLLCVSIGAGDVEACPPGQYYSTTANPPQCTPCSDCLVGQGTTVLCGGTNDTVCNDCLEDTYSMLTSTGGRVCVRCKNCAPKRVESSPCTSTQDRVCGMCSQGYFRYVTSDSSECLPCSECPLNLTALHWLECAAAGEPEDNQCAPGFGHVGYNTVSAKPAVQPTSTKKLTGKTKLPTDHGMFVPVNNGFDAQIEEPTDESLTEKQIAFISMSFTAASLLACMLAMYCLFRNHCRCKKIKQNLSFKMKRPHLPVQVEGDAESTHHPGIS